MKNLLSYSEWKEIHSENTKFEEIEATIKKLNFKGYTSSLAWKDKTGKELLVETKVIDQLSDLHTYDFSNCYLYALNFIEYTYYHTPEGTNAWDYDFIELSKFNKDIRYSYRIRFAGLEKKRNKYETALQ